MTSPVKNGQVARALYHSIVEGQAVENIPGLIKQIIQGQMWASLVIEETGEVVEFDSFEQLVTTPPPEGLGTSLDVIKKLCRDDNEALDMLDEAVQGKQGGHTGNQYSNIGNIDIINVSNVKESKVPDGTSRQAGLRRLRSEIKKAPTPERRAHIESIQAQVLANEKSVHAALVEIGVRQETITIPLVIERAAGILKRRFSREQLDRLVDLLRD